jgi:hypothetical protein
MLRKRAWLYYGGAAVVQVPGYATDKRTLAFRLWSKRDGEWMTVRNPVDDYGEIVIPTVETGT